MAAEVATDGGQQLFKMTEQNDGKTSGETGHFNAIEMAP